MNRLKLFNTVVLFFLSYVGISQELQVTPVVDERTELLSIVFRLAEAKEYINNRVENYVNEVDEYFRPYKKHKVVKYAKKIRILQGVSYDAVMSMAIHIEIVDGQVRMIESVDEKSLEKRWRDKGPEFVELLNDFYQESDFNRFFNNHEVWYNKAVLSCRSVIDKVDFNWFKEYYGVEPKGTFNLCVSLTNWGNYGPSIKYENGQENVYAIIGPWLIDSLGYPVFGDQYLGTIIHEFNHSFCNELIDENYEQLQFKGKEFYELVKSEMRKQAYGSSKTMLYEMLVRASVIKYYQAHFDGDFITEDEVKMMIGREKAKGFIWIKELVDLLDDYVNSDLKTLREFMPPIIKLQNILDPQILYDEYKNNCAMIVSSSIENGDKNVDPKTKELILTFDRPMNINKSGLSYGKKGKEAYPKVTDTKWNQETQLQWTVELNLEPNKQYSLSFPAAYFYDAEDGNCLKETYYLDFKTGKKE